MKQWRAAQALIPLRLFLGGTFVYAGIQKLSDPGFLHPGAPTYIGTQLHGFANGTPGGFILRTFAIPIPEIAGVGVAYSEILIGVLVLAGFYTRWAAGAGMGLNFLLFLTASWHTNPYFLGPDLVFTFAWSPLVIAGAEGQPSLDTMLAERRLTSRQADSGERDAPPPLPEALTRRALMMELGGVAVAIAGASALLKGRYTPLRALGAGRTTAGGHARAAKNPQPSHHSAANGTKRGSSVPADAVKLGPGRDLPANTGANYSDPATGAPDIVIRASNGSLTAFSAVCTHAGCTVGYENGVILCPCHGGEYSPTTGAVIAGPPPAGLESKKVIEVHGTLYAIPS